ncbi:MAG: rod shape-determining protein MreC, partial [Lachnospiraceae bacterium]|nr:rod shape-determining protein MreC [Lachnospiraceae bacterium]
ENEEFRSLLRAKARLSMYEMEEAKIIGSDGVNCFNRFTINKGTIDGIKADMNVINSDGLVGIVTSVGLNYAVVTAIIEDNTSVSAMTRYGHSNCIVKGDLSQSGEGRLLLTNALADFDTERDNALVTSSISDKYLQGLLIGYAEDVKLNADQLTKSGTVKTAVDFTKLDEVLVITTMKEELQETEAEK